MITSISPTSGTRLGGNIVRIEGSGFSDAPFVTLGAQNVTQFHLVSDSALEVIAPPDQVGPASITVVGKTGGRVTIVDGYFYLPIAATTYGERFFADASSSSDANLVVVTATNAALTGIDVEVPRGASGAIEGLLTGADGAPLVGHPVIATPESGGDAIAMPSGVDGKYRIEGLAPGNWIVTTNEPRSSTLADEAYDDVFDAAIAAPVTVVADQTASGVDFALGEGATITGQVRGAAPLEGVTVFAVDDAGRSLQFTYATTDSAGVYTLRGLAPGSYRLVAFAAGTPYVNGFWPDAFGYADATPVPVASNTVTADFDLALGGTISGLVTESGSLLPLPRVTLVAHDVPRDLDFTTASASDGSFTLPPLPPSTFRLEAPELGQFYDAVTSTSGAALLVVSAGTAAAGRNFLGRLSPPPFCASPATTAAFSGKVSGPGGAAVLRAVVTLAGPDSATAITGIDGRWTLDCLAPGTYSLDVHAPGTDFPRRVLLNVATALPATTTPIDVTLSHGPSLAGQVRDSSTHALLPNVLVEITGQNSGETALTTTGPDGRYKIDRFPSGGMGLDSYVVHVPRSVQTEYSPY